MHIFLYTGKLNAYFSINAISAGYCISCRSYSISIFYEKNKFLIKKKSKLPYFGSNLFN